MNDSLEQYFQNNYLTYRRGWILFKEKEYLAKMEHFSDGAYYFKDTTVKESDFETIDDTVANPFKEIDLPLS